MKKSKKVISQNKSKGIEVPELRKNIKEGYDIQNNNKHSGWNYPKIYKDFFHYPSF